MMTDSGDRRRTKKSTEATRIATELAIPLGHRSWSVMQLGDGQKLLGWRFQDGVAPTKSLGGEAREAMVRFASVGAQLGRSCKHLLHRLQDVDNDLHQIDRDAHLWAGMIFARGQLTTATQEAKLPQSALDMLQALAEAEFPLSRAWLATKTGWCERTVRRQVPKLIKLGLVDDGPGGLSLTDLGQRLPVLQA